MRIHGSTDRDRRGRRSRTMDRIQSGDTLADIAIVACRYDDHQPVCDRVLDSLRLQVTRAIVAANSLDRIQWTEKGGVTLTQRESHDVHAIGEGVLKRLL